MKMKCACRSLILINGSNSWCVSPIVYCPFDSSAMTAAAPDLLAHHTMAQPSKVSKNCLQGILQGKF